MTWSLYYYFELVIWRHEGIFRWFEWGRCGGFANSDWKCRMTHGGAVTCSTSSTAQCGRELSEMLLREITWVLWGSCITAVSFKSRLKEGEILFCHCGLLLTWQLAGDVSTGLCRCCECWDRVLAVEPGMQAEQDKVCSRAWGGQRKPQSRVFHGSYK